MNRDQELETFKCRINLSQYAARQGYLLDRKASSRSSAVMKHPNGDKVVIALGEDGHWVYFSIRDDNDNGSIVDFVQKRRGGSLGEVRKELRLILNGTHSPALPPLSYVSTLQPSSKDLIRVRVNLEQSHPIDGHHPYLENERKIPHSVLQDGRFYDRIRIDGRGNAVFPHWNRSGVCGFELKNVGFTGFCPGGEKGLWASHTDEADTSLVIAETAIDALSHFALKKPALTRYVSIAGTLNQTQPDLIQGAAQKLPAWACIFLAVDNDPGGDALVEKLRAILTPLPRLSVIDERPARRGADWNDVLIG